MATVENSVVYIHLTLTLARLVYKYCKYLLDGMMILLPSALCVCYLFTSWYTTLELIRRKKESQSKQMEGSVVMLTFPDVSS